MTIHPTAQIHESCVIGQDGFSFTHEKKRIQLKPKKGVIIGSGTYIAAFCNVDNGIERDTIIGNDCIINTHVHIAHDVQIGNNCEINVHAVICGYVSIGDNTKIAPGAIIHQRVTIGKNCVLGIGSYLRHDMPDGTIFYGNPAIQRQNTKFMERNS